jgi:hypothetical protein
MISKGWSKMNDSLNNENEGTEETEELDDSDEDEESEEEVSTIPNQRLMQDIREEAARRKLRKSIKPLPPRPPPKPVKGPPVSMFSDDDDDDDDRPSWCRGPSETERAASYLRGATRGKPVPEFFKTDLTRRSSSAVDDIDPEKYREITDEWKTSLKSWKTILINTRSYKHVNHSDAMALVLNKVGLMLVFVIIASIVSLAGTIGFILVNDDFPDLASRFLLDGFALVAGILYMIKKMQGNLVFKILRRLEKWDVEGKLKIPITAREFNRLLEGKGMLLEARKKEKPTKRLQRLRKKRWEKVRMKEERKKKREKPVNVIDDWEFERVINYKYRVISSLTDTLLFFIPFFGIALASAVIPSIYFDMDIYTEIWRVVDVISIYFLVQFIGISIFSMTLSRGSIRERLHETFSVFLCNNLDNYIMHGIENKDKIMYIKQLVMYIDFFLVDTMGKTVDNKEDVMEYIREYYFKEMDEKKIEKLRETLLAMPTADPFHVIDCFNVQIPYQKIDVPKLVKLVGTFLSIGYGLVQFAIKTLL